MAIIGQIGRRDRSETSSAGVELAIEPSRARPIGAVALSDGPSEATTSKVVLSPNMLRSASLKVADQVSGGRELAGAARVDRAKAKLDTPGIRTLYDRYGSFNKVLSGQVEELSLPREKRVHTATARQGRDYDIAAHGNISFRKGMAKAWETGVDVNQLVEDRPNERFKFYLSIDASGEAGQERTADFLRGVHEKASEMGLAMLTKTEDHTYDNCNLYTWSPVEMAGILAEEYAKYPDIWNATEHPLQGDIAGVDPMHIGFVQEPIGGVGGSAHSARMGALGRALDEGASFEDACRSASVLPEAPWMVDPTRYL